MCERILQSRYDILKIHSRKMNLMRGIDLKKIAEKMNGASGAELKVWLYFTCFTSVWEHLSLENKDLFPWIVSINLCRERNASARSICSVTLSSDWFGVLADYWQRNVTATLWMFCFPSCMQFGCQVTQ